MTLPLFPAWPQSAIHTNFIKPILDWKASGIKCALATLITTTKTSPRPIGSQMLINSSGESFGYLANGCIENAVIQEALQVIKSGTPKRITYGSEDNFDLKLSCGGRIEVLISPVDSKDTSYETLSSLVAKRSTATQAINLKTGELSVTSGISSPLPGYFNRFHYPPLRLVAVGGDPLILSLVALCECVGVDLHVLRPLGPKNPPATLPKTNYNSAALKESLSSVELDNRTGLLTFTHDDEMDDLVLAHALRSKAFCIGVLGSRSKIVKRNERLTKTHGFGPSDLERIIAPIGLGFGRQEPNLTAFSILAQFLQLAPTEESLGVLGE